MTRNKRTDTKAHEELAPLTEHILTQMGREGDNIRHRLKIFYRQRAHHDASPLESRGKDNA
jgi:hypothetical protein